MNKMNYARASLNVYLYSKKEKEKTIRFTWDRSGRGCQMICHIDCVSILSENKHLLGALLGMSDDVDQDRFCQILERIGIHNRNTE